MNRIIGTDGNDKLYGTPGNDVFIGGHGFDLIVGGQGTDYAIVARGFEKGSNGEVYVNDGFGAVDCLVGIERLVSPDAGRWDGYAFDVAPGQAAGDAYRIYEAAFNRAPDAEGLGYWIEQIDQGMDMVEVAARFIDSPEFRGIYGDNPRVGDFVYRLYTNVLDRAPDVDGFNYWCDQIVNNPEKTPAKVLADFANSVENVEVVGQSIHDGFNYDVWNG